MAALAAAGLVGGGIVAVGQFASADERPATGAVEVAGGSSGPADAERSAESARASETVGAASTDSEALDLESLDLESLDLGVLGLGSLAECLGGILGDGSLFDGSLSDRSLLDGSPLFDDEFTQRMEQFFESLPWGELDLGELDFDAFDDGVRLFGAGGSSIVVVGPDGVRLIDLGDGDGTVTIEQVDGELSIEVDGDARVSELPDIEQWLGQLDLGQLDLGRLDLGGWPALGDIESCLDE